LAGCRQLLPLSLRGLDEFGWAASYSTLKQANKQTYIQANKFLHVMQTLRELMVYTPDNKRQQKKKIGQLGVN